MVNVHKLIQFSPYCRVKRTCILIDMYGMCIVYTSDMYAKYMGHVHCRHALPDPESVLYFENNIRHIVSVAINVLLFFI